jgi:hypothetical protein
MVMEWIELKNKISEWGLIRLALHCAFWIIIGMISGLIVLPLISLFFWSNLTWLGRILFSILYWAKYGVICGGILGATIAVLRVVNVRIIKPQTLLLLVCIGGITLIVLWAYDYFFPPVNRGNWHSVEATFANAMLNNNAWVAKSLTISSEWDKIDSWMVHRNAFKCPPSDEWDVGNGFSGVASYHDENGPVDSYYAYRCYEEPYVFSIDVILEQTEDGWTVTKIVDVCEEKSRWGCD